LLVLNADFDLHAHNTRKRASSIEKQFPKIQKTWSDLGTKKKNCSVTSAIQPQDKRVIWIPPAKAMASDPRKQYLIAAALDVLNGLEALDARQLEELLNSDAAVERFLDREDVMLLSIAVVKNEEKVVAKIANQTETRMDNVLKEVFFLKARPTILPSSHTELSQTVMVHTTSAESPLLSLFLALQNVYAPKIAANGMDEKLQSAVMELNKSLQQSIQQRSTASASGSETDVSGILSVDDELAVWQSLSSSASSASASSSSSLRAPAFLKHLTPLAKNMQKLKKGEGKMRQEEVVRVLEDVQENLLGLWKEEPKRAEPYPQHRMTHLLTLLISALRSLIVSSLSPIAIFRAPFAQVQQALELHIQLCDQWAIILSDLTEQEFSARWRGKRFTDTTLPPLAARLSSLLRLRCLFEELSRLLPPEDSAKFPRNAFAERLEQVPFFSTGPLSEAKWESVLSEVDKALIGVELVAAQLLKARMFAVVDRPHLLQTEFRSFQYLLRRRSISHALQSEYESLLTQLTAYLHQLRNQFELHSSTWEKSPPQSRNMSSTSSGVVWATQLQHKVVQARESVRSALGGVAGYEKFQSLAKELESRFATYAQDLFEQWGEEINQALNDRQQPLLMRSNGRLMELDLSRRGELKVHYSERLVVLLREVRQLSELGYKIPRNIQEAAAKASKLYRYGVQLKQVANFYNTMSEQILKSQMGLLLSEAQNFEEMVRNQQGATWDSPEQVERYMAKLTEAADKLTNRNRKLRAQHAEMGKVVLSMMAADLVRQRDVWNELLKKMQMMFLKEQSLGSPLSAITAWKYHWDHQVYKALALQYRLSLDAYTSASATSTIGDLAVELIYPRPSHSTAALLQTAEPAPSENISSAVSSASSSASSSAPSASSSASGAGATVPLRHAITSLALRPPLEELRQRYYRSLRSFLELPRHFQGLGDGALYSALPARCSPAISSLFARAEAQFTQLSSLCHEYAPWAALVGVDLSWATDKHLVEVRHWELNFKALKRKRKESERLPNSVRIGCFVVSFAALKNSIEDQLQRLWDALLLSLKKSTWDELKGVEEYLRSAMERLTALPKTVEEMAEAKAQWRVISDNKPEQTRAFNRAKEKALLLRQFTGVTIDLKETETQYQLFLDSLEAFHKLLDEQKDKLRQDIERRTKEARLAVDKFCSLWRGMKPTTDSTNTNAMTKASALAILESLNGEWADQLTSVMKLTQAVAQDAESFAMVVPQFQALEDVRVEIEAQQESWSLYGDYAAEMEAMAREKWLEFRSHIFSFEDALNAWTKKLKGRARDQVSDYLSNEIKDYRAIWPLLRKVTGEMFEKEHWLVLFNKLKLPANLPLHQLTLQHFLDHRSALFAQQREIDQLAARAQGEVTIREAVQELRAWADQAEFALLEHQCTSSAANNHTSAVTHLIKDWKQLFTKLSDQQSLVASLKESPYFGPFADTAMQFATKLALLDECLHTLNQIQRKWVYLEPIFARGALPSEQARFRRIDTEFRGLMHDVHQNPNIMALAAVPNLRDTINVQMEQLERCTRALNDFLEAKRARFPRFYFLGDDDLLEILGQSQNPTVIESHLKKLFAGIYSVTFSDDGKQITAMKSEKKEVVPLLKAVTISEDVEQWLSQLSDAMCHTLAELLLACVKELDYNKYPEQILCLAEQIMFTARVEMALAQGEAGAPKALNDLLEACQGQLAYLTSLESGEDRVLQSKIRSLVMDLIHSMDVLRQLISGRAKSLDHWLWHKQLRYYLEPRSGLCAVRMCDAEFRYSYEYQGNAARLVHTPLTDKCYLVLTQGMHLGYGGNPYGPAGTGKTESVKALGHALGRQVLVFNCDEGIDFQAMGRIFTGLVKSGAWGCFDEFNRLKEDQLSAVSQQIQIIQAALKAREATAELLGQTVQVNHNAAIFVTLNPASKEYGGRSRLPHNLKQLFRSVAMSVPDMALISETILCSEGFRHSAVLGRKLVEVYTLSKQLLSPQRHYDWGLRALKTVLGHAGQLVHSARRAALGDKEKKSPEEVKEAELPYEREAELLVAALRVNTLSKLTFGDSQRFEGIILDLFPGLQAQDVAQEQLQAAVHEALKELKLELIPKQVHKIMQLHEALSQRMGVVVVGPSGCGKSTMLQVLQLALSKLQRPVVRHVMNPKALERAVLLGRMDHDTREWFDGVLTAAARQVMREPPEMHSWVMCDGDIDPEWIEALNSVLDDNHLLTMPNGERIKFGDNVNFVFESHDLQFASPATVSRMGMIFLSEEDVDVRALVSSWLSRQEERLQSLLQSWIDNYFYQALEYVMNAGALCVTSTKVGLVLTALSQLRGVSSKGEFVVALCRGMGSNLDMERRTALAREIFGWAAERLPDPRAPLDCFFNAQLGQYQILQPDVRPIAAEAVSWQSPPLVDTVDMQRNRAVLMPWFEAREPVLVVGPEGAGKTLLLTDCFKRLKGCSVVTLHCSAQTSAQHVVQKLSESCASFSTAKGRVLRPREGDRLILFLKDLNLPRPDAYDTIQLVAFLQQLLCYQGFWDASLEWVGVENVQLVACMNPATTVGRHPLSTRFTGIVRLLYIEHTPRDQLSSVYHAYLTSVVRAARVLASSPEQKREAGSSTGLMEPQWGSEASLKKLANAMLELYDKVRSRFSVDDYRHYLFTPRELSQWCFSLLRYDLASVPLLELWCYEAERIFGDRLVSEEARRKFRDLLYTIVRQQFQYEIKLDGVCYTSLSALSLGSGGADPSANDSKAANATSSSSASSSSANAFAEEGDSEAVEAAVKLLGQRLDRCNDAEFKEIVAESLHNYEREYADLNLLLFPEMLTQISRMDRVLSRPGGSLLLVGAAGVGRKGCVTLLSFLHRARFFTPNVTRHYDLRAFRSEIKDLIRVAGVEGQRVVIFVEEHQIVEPSILEDLNSLLSAGQIPALFAPQELDTMLSPLKETLQAQGPALGVRSLSELFVMRVRQNVHVVLSMDPAHPQFAIRCESNPAIYARCHTIWLGFWSQASMLQVPELRLGSFLTSLQTQIPPAKLIELACAIHHSATKRGTLTPASPAKFIAFLETFRSIATSKFSAQAEQKKHLQAGLHKLSEAANAVDVLSRDASTKAQAVARKQQEADQALETITEKMAKASERRVEVEALTKTLGEEEMKLNQRQMKIQNELKEIQPMLEQARAQVKSINRDNINEIRALKAPPFKILNVLQGVLTLLKEDDQSWNNMKKFLGRSSVREDIASYDAKNVTPEMRDKVNKLINANRESFDPDKIRHVNVAAAPLAAWVVAQSKFAMVLEGIKPLRDEFQAATEGLARARQRLSDCQTELSTLDNQVKSLKLVFGKTTGEAETLKAQLASTQATLNRAQELLGKLQGERSRWDGQVKALDQDLAALPLHALLAAGTVCYLGAYPEDVRRDAKKYWMQLCHTSLSSSSSSPLQSDEHKLFDLRAFLSSESEFLKWKAEGLPSDELSAENGLILMHSVQTAFMVDPNTQATHWLKTNLTTAGKPVEVVLQQDARLVSTIELAVRFGKTLIIQEVDGVPPLLYPLLRRESFRQGPRSVIQVGEKAVDYHPNFRLFLVTRQSAPDIAVSLSALMCELNFTVTSSGLEGQLLGLALEHERPELEQKKSALLNEQEGLKVQLAQLEKSLLEELAASEGDLLQNTSLIESLNKTKSQSSVIGEALRNASAIQLDLDQQREVYRPIAHLGSRIFFLVDKLSSVDNMYDFSLSSFLRLFRNNLNTTNTSNNNNNASQRVQSLCFE